MTMRTAALLAVLPLIAPVALFGQTPAVNFDAVVRRMMTQEGVVGASVLVARDGHVVFHRGYGFADLGLDAPTTAESVYHIVGPMMPFTGVAVLQQAELGKLSLDDDVAKFIPEFPMQGRRVTVRELLNHTSGIVDYHYLGDAIEATSRQPKALDEVMALYAGKEFVHEPGLKWDWSISGFQLLVTIVERVSGQSFPDYVRQHILEPAGVTSTTYCDDFTLTRGLSHGYRKFEKGYVAAHENDMAYNTDLRFCSTVGDLYRLWTAIGAHHLLSPDSFKLMTADVGAVPMSADDPKAKYGLALMINHEEDHRRVGQHGSLLGYSGSLYEFPGDRLTIVVLTNTEGQNAYAMTRALARAVLGLPALPSARPAAAPVLADVAVSAAERAQLDGTFVLKLDRLSPGLHDSFAQYRRTYRVFDENGRLMLEPLAEGAERLLKQPDGSFAVRSAPATRVTFVVENGHAILMRMDSTGLGVPLSGARVGNGDARTFDYHLK